LMDFDKLIFSLTVMMLNSSYILEDNDKKDEFS
jgi:hypothetical protein